MAIGIDKRGFMVGLGGTALAWPLAVRAQQPAMPMVGFVGAGSADTSARLVTAFRRGLSERGYVEGQNVTIEYHWLQGHYDRLPALMSDLVSRQVAVIATPIGAQSASNYGRTNVRFGIISVGHHPRALGPVRI
jgi:putative ABC transport system substrate-binding protein